jgi:hypothetical protein
MKVSITALNFKISFQEMFGGEFRCYAKRLSIAIGNRSENPLTPSNTRR